MARYKKKKHSNFFGRKKPKKSTVNTHPKNNDDIKMTSQKEPKNGREKREKMRVVSGKKAERSLKFKRYSAIAIILLVCVIVIQLLMPAGVIQTLSNSTALIGGGSYPITMSGTHHYGITVMKQCYFDLSDSHLAAYSNAGKQLFSYAHGLEKPVLVTSAGRVLLYNQGGTELHIFDFRGLKTSLKVEKAIYCATISDSGNFAVATQADKYATAVTVYSKREKVVYEWYSAEDIVNNIALSSSGQKLAVSTFNSESGLLNSKVNILNFKSATPEHTKTYDKTLVLALKNSNRTNLSIINSNGVDYLRWSHKKINEYKSDYSISLFKVNPSYNVAVFCRENDKTDNQIVIFSKRGVVKKKFQYKGIIKDIEVKGRNVYCMNDSEVFFLDFEGKKQKTVSYGYGGTGLAVLSTDSVAIALNNEIKKIKF